MKNMALGQVAKKNRGHVDTVWDMKQVYTRTTLNSKYVTTVYELNSLDSLKVNLRKSAMLPRFRK